MKAGVLDELTSDKFPHSLYNYRAYLPIKITVTNTALPKHADSSSNISDLYLGGVHFKSHLGHCLFCLRFFIASLSANAGMYVCIRGGHLRPLHRDAQWSIVLPLSLVIPSAISHFEHSAGFCTWGCRNSHLVP
jgi:hypothetical protein